MSKPKGPSWLSKTRSLYGTLKRREQEYLKVKVDLPFTLEEFRAWLNFRELAREYRGGNRTWRCYLCNRPVTIQAVSIDHVKPLAHAGRTTLDNLRPCCTSCNRAKGALSLSGYRSVIETVRQLNPNEQRYFWARWSAGSRTRWTEAKRADDRKAREILRRAKRG